MNWSDLIPPILNFKHKAPTSEVVATPSRLLYEILQSVPADAGLITTTGRSRLEEVYGLKVFQEMASDPQVKAALSVKEAAIQTSRWHIRPYDDSDKARKQVEMLTYMMRGMLGDIGIGFKPLVKGAYRYGRSDCELTYEYLKYGPYKGYYRPKPLKQKNPGFISYEMDEFDNIIGFRTKNFHGEERQVKPDRIIRYAYEAEFGNPYGTFALISCYPWHYAKKSIYKFMMIFCDKYASPVPVVTTERQLSQTDEAKLDNAAKNYHISNFFKLPKGVSLEMFQNNGAAGDIYIQAIREADSQMARGIFSNTLTIGESDKSGTHAQAKVHKGTLKDIVTYNMNDLEELVANQQLIKRIVDVNEANPDGYCTFHFDQVDPAALNEMADAIVKLANCMDDKGNPVVHCQEPWIRTYMSIPDRDKKEFPLNTTRPDWMNPAPGGMGQDAKTKFAKAANPNKGSADKKAVKEKQKKLDKA